MAANKAQLIDVLAHLTGLTEAQAETAVNKLPDALGIWMKSHGADAPGHFAGEMADGLSLEMTRDTAPAPHWEVKVSLTAGGLADFGDGSDRFGLPVENA